jgi:hypothetical protein
MRDDWITFSQVCINGLLVAWMLLHEWRHYKESKRPTTWRPSV